LSDTPNPSEPVDTAENHGNDPLAELWHWTDHPIAGFGMTIGVLIALVLFFIGLAQITF